MSQTTELDHNFSDTTPGDERLDGSGVAHGVQGYLLGLLLALGLTIASFYLSQSELIWSPAVPAALISLAIAQVAVHIVFFLHITTGPDSANNVIALIFGVVIVTVLIAGSLFIMSNLTHNMPSMSEIMQMQR